MRCWWLELGFPPNELGLHSLRAGGATAAANAKDPDQMFKRHSRWKSVMEHKTTVAFGPARIAISPEFGVT